MNGSGHDRGAFGELVFQRCQRGFLLRESSYERIISRVWAFDRVEDVAAWLVEQYGNPPEPEESSPAATKDAG